MTVRATARVQLTVEVNLTQPWGHDSTIQDIHKTACDEARRIFYSKTPPSCMRIVGEPKVTVVTIDEDRP